ncbi:MAG: glycosyltransferase [Chloroflexota bacterium]
MFVSSRDLYARAEAGWGAQPGVVAQRGGRGAVASAQTLTLEEPLDLAGIPHPRLLLYGTLRECVDARFLADVARERPSWQMVLIGPMAGMDVAPIARLPNVHLMGPRANERLPSYLQYSDICMIPYRDDDVTRAIDPVKVYEYLAAGKPVISTPLPELSRFEEVVTVVRTAPEFVATAERILSRPDPGKAVRQLQAVRDQSWDRRGSRAEELVRIALTQRIRHAHD